MPPSLGQSDPILLTLKSPAQNGLVLRPHGHGPFCRLLAATTASSLAAAVLFLRKNSPPLRVSASLEKRPRAHLAPPADQATSAFPKPELTVQTLTDINKVKSMREGIRYFNSTRSPARTQGPFAAATIDSRRLVFSSFTSPPSGRFDAFYQPSTSSYFLLLTSNRVLVTVQVNSQPCILRCPNPSTAAVSILGRSEQ